eukprot:XP_011671720.1 PREDICTED: uncharacterized protein LOC105441865 [Strongylocentrotus purpuratus]
MTCMFAVALSEGGPIRRPASQLEKTALIRGNVTLLCPFVPNDLWKVVYWLKNNNIIYSLDVKRNIRTTMGTRYEGSNHATRLMIKDLRKTDGGIYLCRVETLFSIKERGKVLLSVTDQEVGFNSTTSPGVPFRASTMIPSQPAVDNTIFLVFLICAPITMCLVLKYRKQILQ